MIELTGQLLKSDDQTLTNGKVLRNHHFLVNGYKAPYVIRVQDWGQRSLPVNKQHRIPVSVSAWKSKSGNVGLQFTLNDNYEVK